MGIAIEHDWIQSSYDIYMYVVVGHTNTNIDIQCHMHVHVYDRTAKELSALVVVWIQPVKCHVQWKKAIIVKKASNHSNVFSAGS